MYNIDRLLDIVGHKHTKPHKNFSHKYKFFAINFFGIVCASHLELFLVVLSIFD
jgi:hypothetical protein